MQSYLCKAARTSGANPSKLRAANALRRQFLLLDNGAEGGKIDGSPGIHRLADPAVVETRSRRGRRGGDMTRRLAAAVLAGELRDRDLAFTYSIRSLGSLRSPREPA